MEQTQFDGAKTHIRLERKCGFYELYIKRLMDIVCSVAAIVAFSWLYIIVAVLVRVKLGSPVLFKQPRPGKIDPKTGQEKIFYMYKFRSMSDERDEHGNLLPDEVRLGKFGKALRATSLDELPEVFNILKSDMTLVGPRPQLIRDMVFMTDKQRMRHTAKPGLSGLAQVNGRNDISWEEKLNWDLKYIEKVSFLGDVKIIFQTVMKAFVKQEGITDGDMATAYDYGDWLLKEGKVSKEEYLEKKEEAKKAAEGVRMRLLKAIYEKTHNKPAPYYYNYSLGTVIFKPIRKWMTNTVAANCPFNSIRIAIYRMCGFKIGKGTFIGMRCYLDDMCYDLLRIGDNVTISYGVYFACHGKGQEHLPITIDDGAYIGMRASIISKNVENLRGGVHIYSHATIGACTLVNQDIPESTTAVGIPCRIIYPADSSNVRCQQDEKMEVLQSCNDTDSGSE